MNPQYILYKQDVFEGLLKLIPDSFDLCIVDPPYGASSKHNWDYGKKGRVAGFGGEWNLENEVGFVDPKRFFPANIQVAERVETSGQTGGVDMDSFHIPQFRICKCLLPVTGIGNYK